MSLSLAIPSSEHLEIMVKNGEAGKILNMEPWDSIHARLPQNPAFYINTARNFRFRQLNLQSINTYILARKVGNNQFLYAMELADLHQSLFKYCEATSEYLNHLLQEPAGHFNMVQSRILNMLHRRDFDTLTVTECIKDFNTALSGRKWSTQQETVKADSALTFSRFMLVQIYLKNAKLNDALAEIKKIKHTAETFKIVNNFAGIALRNGSFQAGIDLLNFYLGSMERDSAYEILELTRARLYSEAGKKREALESLLKLSKSANKDIALSGILSLADLYFESYYDFDNALKYYQKYVQVSPKQHSDLQRVSFRQAECLIRLDSITAAKNIIVLCEKSIPQTSEWYS
ncbi:MAG: hypothetical protein ABIA63_11190, partial [bacterium]